MKKIHTLQNFDWQLTGSHYLIRMEFQRLGFEELQERPNLVRIIESAHRAPSSHNTQPWLFHIYVASSDYSTVDSENNVLIDVFADGGRWLKVADYSGRELLVSCGCALENLLIAAEAEGFSVDCKFESIEHITDEWMLVAQVHMHYQSDNKSAIEDHHVDGLYKSIKLRVTFRGEFSDRLIPLDVKMEIMVAAESEACRLVFVENDLKKKLSDMIYDSNDVQWNDPKFRSELASWIKPFSSGEGLRIGPDCANCFTQVAFKNLSILGNFIGSRDRDLALSAPALGILFVNKSDNKDWVYAGQSLQRALLVASKHDLFASYFNQPIQVSKSFEVEQALGITDATACVMFRLGYADNPDKVRCFPSARRLLFDIV
jgi:hypothetical protein